VKNKKLIVSLLSTALISSMAASAFAAPKDGIYLGGNVNKYYDLGTYVNNSQQALSDINSAISGQGGLANVLYVDQNGTVGASGNDIMAKGGLTGATHELKADDFTSNEYTDVKTNAKLEPKKEFDQPAGELKVESVSAISSTKVKVDFNKAVETLTKDNVTVTVKASSEKVFVKSVTLSEDKKSATVEFYDSLTSQTTYTVAVKSGDVTATKDFDYAKAEVASIEIANQVVPAGVATALNYKVLDANGLDITADVQANVEYESSVGLTNGKIQLADGASAFVIVKVKKADGTYVKSNKITVKGENRKAAELVNWTIAPVSAGSIDWDAKDYKQNTMIKLGAASAKFYTQHKDQFGDLDETLTGTTWEYESLDKDVVLVDRTTGVLTGLKAGSAPVKITAKNADGVYFTKTVEVQVGETATATTLNIDKAELSLSSKYAAGQTVKLTVKDQFGDDFKAVQDLEATVKSGADLVTVTKDTAAGNTAEFQFTIKPKDANKEGTAVIEFNVKGKDVKTTLTVNVVKAGDVADFVTEGFKTSLDKNDPDLTDTEYPNKMEVKLTNVDANGTKLDPANVTYKVVQDDTKATVQERTSATTAPIVIDANGTITGEQKALYTKGKSYTLTVYVGTIEAYKNTFSVVDTSATPTLTQKSNKIETTFSDADTTVDIYDKIADSFDVNFNGKVLDEGTGSGQYTITKLYFTSDNTNVVDSTTTAGATAVKVLAKGAATLKLSKVEVTIDGQAYDVATNAQIEVNSTDAVVVTDATELFDALANDNVKTITLGKDITGVASAIVLDNNEQTLDGNGYEIETTSAVTTEAIQITADDVTVQDLDVDKAIVISGDGALVDGVTVTPSTTSLGDTAGIFVTGEDAEINGVTIDGTGVSSARGVLGTNGASFAVNGSTITNVVTGIYANAAGSGSVTLTATGNTISDVTAGIGGTENTTLGAITGNTFADATEGIGLATTATNVTGISSKALLIKYLLENNSYASSVTDDVVDYTVTPAEPHNN